MFRKLLQNIQVKEIPHVYHIPHIISISIITLFPISSLAWLNLRLIFPCVEKIQPCPKINNFNSPSYPLKNGKYQSNNLGFSKLAQVKRIQKQTFFFIAQIIFSLHHYVPQNWNIFFLLSFTLSKDHVQRSHEALSL